MNEFNGESEKIKEQGGRGGQTGKVANSIEFGALCLQFWICPDSKGKPPRMSVKERSKDGKKGQRTCGEKMPWGEGWNFFILKATVEIHKR